MVGIPQPEFSPVAAQPWEVRWGKLNSKPDMPTYTARLQALRGLKEIECPEPFEGFLVLLFDNEADANVAALLLKEFILRSDDGSTLPSAIEGPKLRTPPPPPATPPLHPTDGGDGSKGERPSTPRRKREESGEACATDPKILAVEREQRAQAQRLVATNARLDQLDEKITENSKAVNEITTNVAHLVQKQAVDKLKQSTQWHDRGLLDKKAKAILRRGQLPKLNKLKQYYVVQPDEDEAQYVISQCLVEEYAPISSTIKLLDGPCQDETIETHPIWVFGAVADASKAMDALYAILIIQDAEVAKAMGSEMDTTS